MVKKRKSEWYRRQVVAKSLTQVEKNRLYNLSIVDKTTKLKAEKAKQQAELPDDWARGASDYANKITHNVHIASCPFCDEHDVR